MHKPFLWLLAFCGLAVTPAAAAVDLSDAQLALFDRQCLVGLPANTTFDKKDFCDCMSAKIMEGLTLEQYNTYVANHQRVAGNSPMARKISEWRQDCEGLTTPAR
jgi:hypothetical protein